MTTQELGNNRRGLCARTHFRPRCSVHLGPVHKAVMFIWCVFLSQHIIGCGKKTSPEAAADFPDASEMSSRPDAAVHDEPVQQNVSGCRADSDCAGSFCDRDECLMVDEASGHGVACTPPPIGADGTAVGRYDYCGDYACIEERCRSCASGAQCYLTMGLKTCAPMESGLGFKCQASSAPGGDTFELPAFEQRMGEPLTPRTSSSCASERFRPSLSPDASWTSPRLAVVWWHQRIGEPDPYLHIAYDAPLAEAIESGVPLNAIGAPQEQNLICYRACTDRSECPCIDSPAFGVGSIMVVLDTNSDGVLSAEEVRSEQVAGTSDVVMGWSSEVVEATLPVWEAYADRLESGACVYSTDVVDSPYLRPMTNDEVSVALATCPAGDTTCSFDVPSGFCVYGCDTSGSLNRFGL